MQFLPLPEVEDDSTEVGVALFSSHTWHGPEDTDLGNQVWLIPQTGEAFVNYEDYLDR